MSRFFPLTSRLARPFSGRPDLAAAAVEVVEVCPSETARTKPVLMRDAERALVERTQEATTPEQEWRRINGGEVAHGATMRYRLRNALATPFGVFTSRAAYYRYGPIRYRALLNSSIPRRERGFYGGAPVTMRYFGHWLRDGLTTAHMRRDDEDLYLPVKPSWSHAVEYVKALDIDRIEADHVMFDDLWLSHDVGQNADRVRRLNALRKRVRTAAGNGGHPGVYLRRGNAGTARRIANEDALVEALKGHGFAIADADAPLREIWAACGGAPVTVSMEGSHWNHAFLASQADALHITINPADRFNNISADFVSGTPGQLATTVAPRRGDGYEVNVETILGFIKDAAPPSLDLTGS